jgi:hypothetical protein
MKRRTAYLSPGPQQPDVALRGVMQALVRIQAYMLADIVVAIPAVDLAIERQWCEGGSESVGVCCPDAVPLHQGAFLGQRVYLPCSCGCGCDRADVCVSCHTTWY